MATAVARPKALLVAGLVLTTLSLGLPWGFFSGSPSYLTLGYYVGGYCDSTYCYPTAYVPGEFVPGLPGGDIEGFWTDARFFIVGAFALALIGWRLGRAWMVRAAALVAAACIALYVSRGLTGGVLAFGLAACCFWLAAREVPDRDVIRSVETGAPSV